MLVLRKSTMSFMCLSFCQHYQPQDSRTHWHVCSEDRAQETGDNDGLTPLEIVLRPYGRSDTTKYSPMPNTTINIQDIWNVENEVYVKPLGEVAQRSLRPLVQAVKDLLCQNLDQIAPQVVEAEPLPEQTLRVEVRTHGSQSEDHKVREERHRKGRYVRYHTSGKRRDKVEAQVSYNCR